MDRVMTAGGIALAWIIPAWVLYDAWICMGLHGLHHSMVQVGYLYGAGWAPIGIDDVIVWMY